MNAKIKLLVAIVALTAMFSSCKKSTDLSILTGHKWSVTSGVRSYSDSSVTHNLLQPDTICQSSSYTEFHDNATNSPLRLAYTYATTNCPGQIFMPDLGISSWNIDPDNTVLYLNGNTTDGADGSWYTIASISKSSIVLTLVYQNSIGTTGAPNFTPIYHTVTDKWTYTAQ